MEIKVNTSPGTGIRDCLRIFHGDCPAAEFEAGHKQGGNSSCVGCGAETTRCYDVVYSYHSPKM